MAKLVGELSIRWTTAGHNVPTVAGAIHAELGVQLEVDQMLELVVAWEEINSLRYDPALGKFVKCAVKTEPTHQAKSSHKSLWLSGRENLLSWRTRCRKRKNVPRDPRRAWSIWVDRPPEKLWRSSKTVRRDWLSGC